MKTLTTFLITFIAFWSFSQTCTINYGNSVPGPYPANLSTGMQGTPFSEDVTLLFPTKNGGGINYTSFKITSMELPLGLTWKCLNEANDCAIDPQQDPFTCVHIYGTPAETGVFTVKVNADAQLANGTSGSYSFQLNLTINGSTSTNSFFTLSPAILCESGKVDFTLNNPINYTPTSQTTGVHHQWSFGNGNSSQVENPPQETYNTVGKHLVTYTQTVDTIGFSFNSITITTVGCSDAIGYGEPDIYVEIYDGNNNLVATQPAGSSEGSNTSIPKTFYFNTALANPPYSINVMDNDDDDWGGIGDAADNCVNGDGNDYKVAITLPPKTNLGTTANTITEGSLTFSYSISKDTSIHVKTDTVYVYAKPTAPVLTIDMNSPVTASTPDMGYVYQWEKDGNRLYGARGALIHPQTTGNYTVIAVNAHGCYTASNSELIDFAAIEEQYANQFSIYPNPSTRVVHIQLKQAQKNTTIAIVDLSGRVVLQQSLDNIKETQLNITHLANGIYSIVLKRNNITQSMKKIVVQH